MTWHKIPPELEEMEGYLTKGNPDCPHCQIKLTRDQTPKDSNIIYFRCPKCGRRFKSTKWVIDYPTLICLFDEGSGAPYIHTLMYPVWKAYLEWINQKNASIRGIESRIELDDDEARWEICGDLEESEIMRDYDWDYMPDEDGDDSEIAYLNKAIRKLISPENRAAILRMLFFAAMQYDDPYRIHRASKANEGVVFVSLTDLKETGDKKLKRKKIRPLSPGNKKLGN